MIYNRSLGLLQHFEINFKEIKENRDHGSIVFIKPRDHRQREMPLGSSKHKHFLANFNTSSSIYSVLRRLFEFAFLSSSTETCSYDANAGMMFDVLGICYKFLLIKMN
jgi:hypothetical protein